MRLVMLGEVVRVIKEEKLLENVKATGEVFLQGLREAQVK